MSGKQGGAERPAPPPHREDDEEETAFPSNPPSERSSLSAADASEPRPAQAEALRLVFAAVRSKDAAALEAVLQERRAELDGGAVLDAATADSEQHKDTALTLCCRLGFQKGVELLVAAGAGVDSSCADVRT